MMIFSEAVYIPEAPGKLVFKKKGENTYVFFETGRKYDPERQYNIPERKMIGIQIPDQPELMLPNENYLMYFENGRQRMTKEQEGKIRKYESTRERSRMLRSFFDHVYSQFLIMSRRTPEYPVSMEKVKRINRILRPLMEVMKEEACAEFLETIPETGEEEESRLTCSDVAMLLTIFKTATDQYFIRHM